MIYRVYVFEPDDGFYGCIGEYDTKEEAEKRADEARRARNPIYYLDVMIEENND